MQIWTVPWFLSRSSLSLHLKWLLNAVEPLDDSSVSRLRQYARVLGGSRSRGDMDRKAKLYVMQ